MAWISVHEDVLGPKLRDFTKRSELSRNEALGTLIVLWLWGIKNAEPNGRIKSADREDVADVIASGLSDGTDAINVVNCMVDAGWIDERDGELYLHDWDEWQEMWYSYLGRKEKDTARKRRARDKERDAEGPPPVPQLPDGPPPAPPKVEKPKKPEKKRYAEFVHLHEDEYKKLVSQIGQKAAEKCIEILDNYKGAKGKSYKDDYRAILNWVIKRVNEDFPGLAIAQDAPAVGAGTNPYEEWGDMDE